MLPYKTCRGREALKRVRAFEGVPPRYQKVKKQVAPHAMRVICLAPGRKVLMKLITRLWLLTIWLQYCALGRISHECGWKYQDVVKTLENKRKIKASVAYGRKKQLKVFSFQFSLVFESMMITNTTQWSTWLFTNMHYQLTILRNNSCHDYEICIYLYLIFTENQGSGYQGCFTEDCPLPENCPLSGSQIKVHCNELNTPMWTSHLFRYLHSTC